MSELAAACPGSVFGSSSSPAQGSGPAGSRPGLSPGRERSEERRSRDEAPNPTVGLGTIRGISELAPAPRQATWTARNHAEAAAVATFT